MSKANPLWGAPRIHGELLKLGIKISQATVGRWMPWCPKVPSPTWRTFLRNHLPDIAAIDMFVVPRRRFRRQHSEASEQGRVRPSRLRPRRQSRRGPPPQGLGKGAPPPRISDPCGQGIETYARDRARAAALAGSPMRARSASRHWPQPRSRIHTLTSPRCTWTFPIRPTLFIYSGAWHSSSVPPVCTENLVRIDLMRESLNVGHDGRADISLRAGLYKDRANKANVKIGQRKCHITST